MVLLCFAAFSEQAGQGASAEHAFKANVLDRSGDPHFAKVQYEVTMWDEESYYDSNTESREYDDSDEEQEYYEPYDPSELTYGCRYGCTWSNDWCSFDVTTPQTNWSKTANSSSAAPDLPPGVTEKVRCSSSYRFV